MRFEPLIPWTLAVSVVVLCVVMLAAWALVRLKKRQKPTVKQLRLVGIVALLLLILFGPSLPGDRAPAGMLNLDVLIAIDRTTSMSAEDYDGKKTRLEGVQSDLLKLIDKVKGARIAVITFDSTAKVRLPFTSDNTTVSTMVKVLDPEISVYSKGSAIDKPLELIVTTLKKAKETHPDRGRLLFYVGDGEQTAETAIRSFSEVKSLVDGGAVLGYGTSQGGHMKDYFGFSEYKSDVIGDGYVSDYSQSAVNGFQRALSKIDESNLQAIARDTGLAYVHRTSLEQPLDEIVDKGKLTVVADTKREVLRYVSLYWVVSIAVVALLLWWSLELSGSLTDGIKKGRES